MLKLTTSLFAAAAVAATMHAHALHAQNPPAAQEVAKPLEIGAVAPDFELPGATRYGLLRDPVHLSDFKGKTVVLAFFFKARTKG